MNTINPVIVGAEKALTGALLAHPESFHDLGSRIHADMFTQPGYRMVIDALA